MRKLLLFVLLLGFAFTLQADISSAHLWVNTTAGGSPSRSSTPIAYNSTHAYGSMQAALTAASAGDLIGIKNGTYSSQSITSGGKASAVSFYAETSGSVLVASLTSNVDKVHYYGIIASGTGQSRGSLTVISGSTVFTDVIIDGFRGLSGYVQSSGVTVQNAEFGNTVTSICGSSSLRATEDAFRFWGGAYGNPSNDKLLNSTIHDWISDSAGNCSTYGAYDVHADGVQVYPTGSNITISGNKFYNNATNNVQSGGGSQTGWVVENNYFGAPLVGSNRFTVGQASACSVSFRNNVFDVAGYAGSINADGSAQYSPCTLEMSGNIMIGSTAGCTAGSSGTVTVTGGYNVETSTGTCASNLKHCTPTWLNGTPSSANGYDIRLASTDTCAIGAGNPASYPATDMYGTTRPQGASPDAGAFEYGAGTAPTITTASLASGTVGVAYSQTLTATPTSPPPAWTVTVGSLPAWATLNSATGAITGTPNAAATTNFTVQAANGTLPNATKALSITIAAATVAPTISSTSPLPSGTVGTVYNTSGYQFTGTGTPAPTWSATGVPGGLSLSSAGALTGTPTTAGTFTLAVTATNGTAPDATGNFSITIAAPAPSSVSLLGSVSIVGNASIGAAPGAILAYASPSCVPAAAAPHNYATGTSSGAAWNACGPYPTTTPPALPDPAGCPVGVSTANACTPGYTTSLTDPDTGNRILRVTQNGSLNNTSMGNRFYTQFAGWFKAWASDDSKFIINGDGRVLWVGFNPATMALTGQSGQLPSIGPGSWNFDPTNPAVIYGLNNSTIQKYTINSNGTLSAATNLVDLSTLTGYVSGQTWAAMYMGGPVLFAYSNASGGQGTGRLIASYDTTNATTHLIDLGQTAATVDGVAITGIDVGGMGGGNGTHSLIPGEDGRYLFVDTGYTGGTQCLANFNAHTAPPHNSQFVIDLQTGAGKQLGLACDQTHVAMGWGGIFYQSTGMTFNQSCAYSNFGPTYRLFSSLPDVGVYTSGCYPANSNVSSHFTWANNLNDGNANLYPVVVDQWANASNIQCLGCNEIDAWNSTTTQSSASVFRFGQTWKTGTGTGTCSDYISRSAQVSPSGKYVTFLSDWLGGTGTGGSCSGGHRTDIFIMELK